MIARKDLVERISADLRVSRTSVDRVLVHLFRCIADMVHAGEVVQILGFGRFYARHARAMRALSIHTGEMQEIPARSLFAFRASDMIKACPELSVEPSTAATTD